MQIEIPVEWWITLAVASALCIGFVAGFITCALLSGARDQDEHAERLARMQKMTKVIE